MQGKPTQANVPLSQLGAGDARAVDRLLPLIYGELRRLAQRLLGREKSGHTLQPTALVHEVYLKLVDQSRVEWQGKTHFYHVAALAMRRLLKEHARRRGRAKRGGGMARVTMDEAADLRSAPEVDALDLDEAFERLSSIDSRAGRVAELRLLTGLAHEEISHVLGVDRRTVERDWRFARARLITLLEVS